jgi:hypothetical protein
MFQPDISTLLTVMNVRVRRYKWHLKFLSSISTGITPSNEGDLDVIKMNLANHRAVVNFYIDLIARMSVFPDICQKLWVMALLISHNFEIYLELLKIDRKKKLIYGIY